MVLVTTCLFGNKVKYLKGLLNTLNVIQTFPHIEDVYVFTNMPEKVPKWCTCFPLMFEPAELESNAMSRMLPLSTHDAVLCLDANAFDKRPTMDPRKLVWIIEEMEHKRRNRTPWIWTGLNFWKHDRLTPYSMDAGVFGAVCCASPAVAKSLKTYGETVRIRHIFEDPLLERRFQTGYALDEKWLHEVWLKSIVPQSAQTPHILLSQTNTVSIYQANKYRTRYQSKLKRLPCKNLLIQNMDGSAKGFACIPTALKQIWRTRCAQGIQNHKGARVRGGRRMIRFRAIISEDVILCRTLEWARLSFPELNHYDFVLCQCIVVPPHSLEQPVHRDHQLGPKQSLTLVLNLEDGGNVTTLFQGSVGKHRYQKNSVCSLNQPCVLFDSFLRHAGAKNDSDQERFQIFFTYVRCDLPDSETRQLHSQLGAHRRAYTIAE